MKIAVIIKHPYRGNDWRIDIVECDESPNYAAIKKVIEREMLGPFEVVAMTSKINFDRKVNLDILTEDTDKHDR